MKTPLTSLLRKQIQQEVNELPRIIRVLYSHNNYCMHNTVKVSLIEFHHMYAS